MQQIKDQDCRKVSKVKIDGVSGAYLKSADQRIVHLVLKQLASLVVHARPAPHILISAGVLRTLKDTSSNAPHDDTEDEEANSKDGVIYSSLLRSSVASFPVRIKDHQAKC